MTDYVLTREADNDLSAIAEYLASKSSTAAAYVITELHRTCERLVRFPRSGYVRPELPSGEYRVTRAFSYLLVYRWRTSPLQIVMIVHASRNLPPLLNLRGLY